MRSKSILTVLIAGTVLMGCVTPPQAYDYSAFREENPRSILVVPPINNTVVVDAQDFYLSTISRPVGERGYYVFPVNVVKRILEDEGLSDANLVHESDPKLLAELFGADAVLYVTIQRWDAQYIVFDTTVTVELDYVLKSGKTGDVLWQDNELFSYSSSNTSSTGTIADILIYMVAAAAEKASPNYVPVARQVNYNATSKPKQGVPAGPYHPMHGADGELF